MRKEKENRVIDNQFDRIHPLGILFHCQSTRNGTYTNTRQSYLLSRYDAHISSIG